MTNYTWYPGSMPFPADYITAAYYPYNPKYRGRACSAGGTCSVGLARAYPTYANQCQKCAPSAPGESSCANKYPDFWHGKGYYNPYGTPYGSLLYGTSEGTCDAKRGCLDPKAVNYDKFALTHCQDMCIYKKPRICISQPPAPPLEQPCPCDVVEEGRTATQAIYDAPRGTRAGVFGPRAFAHNYYDVDSNIRFEGLRGGH